MYFWYAYFTSNTVDIKYTRIIAQIQVFYRYIGLLLFLIFSIIISTKTSLGCKLLCK